MQEVSQFERFLRGGKRSSVVVSLASSSGLAIKAADDEARIRSLLGHAQASTATRLSLALGTIDPASVAAIDAPDLWEDAAALLREVLAEGGPDDPRMEPIVRRFEAQLDARRQQILGVSHYAWRSRDDGDVRPTHTARDDRIFSWDEKPSGGHPGEDFGCRCHAEPVIDDEPHEPMGGLELALFTETAEIIGGLEAARDAGIETWNGVAILAEGLWNTTVYGLSELLVPLGAEWLRPRRNAVRDAIREELDHYDERLAQAWEELKKTPELARAFADYLAAVEDRAAGAVDAYRRGEITEAELREALRERAYLRTTIALAFAPSGLGQAALIARLAGRSRAITRFLTDESGALGRSDASAMRAAAAAQRNLDALRGIRTLPGTGIVWGRGIQQQGRPWEDALEATGEHGRRLTSNFPAIDFFEEASLIATSAKTLDLRAHTYTTRPSTIHGTLKRYLDGLDSFNGARTRYEGLIEGKRLVLAIPDGTSARQMGEVARAMEYARERGIEMRVFVAP